MAKQTQRLDRFLTHTTDLTRSLAKKALHREEVSVNGEVVKNPALQLHPEDRVCWRGERLQQQTGPRYLLLHKPLGYECTARSSHHPRVVDLLAELPAAQSLQAVGRLDVATSGLLFLTDDGQWLHQMTSPRYAKEKVYRAKLAEPLVADAQERLANGLLLDGDTKPTRPAALEVLDEEMLDERLLNETWVRLRVTEGRYHLVRRLFAALGNHVVSLHREAVAGLWLEAQALEPGQWRSMSQDEAWQLARAH